MVKNVLKASYLLIRKFFLIPFFIFRKKEEFSPQEVKKILVFRYDRIGDMVLSTAVFKALKRKFPESEIIVVASLRNREILENNPVISKVILFENTRKFIEDIKKEQIDLAIDLFLTYELKQAWLIFLSRAKYRIGFEKAGREIFFNLKGPDLSFQGSMFEHFSCLLKCIDVDMAGCLPEVFLKEEEKARAKDFLLSKGIKIEEPIIVLHPGGFYPAQRWPLENFGALAKEIMRNYKTKIIVFGEEKEKKELQGLKDNQELAGFEIICGMSLRQVMALLSYCRLLICNNSGILHIAAALKIPTVSTMGPTDPMLWQPIGENNIVIRKDLPCSPCGKDFCSRHDCMKLISVEELMAAVDNLAKKRGLILKAK